MMKKLKWIHRYKTFLEGLDHGMVPYLNDTKMEKHVFSISEIIFFNFLTVLGFSIIIILIAIILVIGIALSPISLTALLIHHIAYGRKYQNEC